MRLIKFNRNDQTSTQLPLHRPFSIRIPKEVGARWICARHCRQHKPFYNNKCLVWILFHDVSHSLIKMSMCCLALRRIYLRIFHSDGCLASQRQCGLGVCVFRIKPVYAINNALRNKRSIRERQVNRLSAEYISRIDDIAKYSTNTSSWTHLDSIGRYIEDIIVVVFVVVAADLRQRTAKV